MTNYYSDKQLDNVLSKVREAENSAYVAKKHAEKARNYALVSISLSAISVFIVLFL